MTCLHQINKGSVKDVFALLCRNAVESCVVTLFEHTLFLILSQSPRLWSTVDNLLLILWVSTLASRVHSSWLSQLLFTSSPSSQFHLEKLAWAAAIRQFVDIVNLNGSKQTIQGRYTRKRQRLVNIPRENYATITAKHTNQDEPKCSKYCQFFL